MIRPLCAAILATSFGFAPSAQADRLLYRLPSGTTQQTYGNTGNQAAQILGGLAVIGALGYALNKLGDDDDDDRARRKSHYRGWDDRRRWDDRHRWDDRRGRGHRYGHRASGTLPGQCLRSTRGGDYVVGTECLYRSGVNVSRLPYGCGTRVIAGGRERRAFDARCLDQNGWRVARHR